MPLKKIKLIAQKFSIVALFATIATCAAVPASASAATLSGCPVVPLFQVFAGFGDSAWYSLAPNGTFLNNAAGWSLTGNATLVPDTEPFNLLDFTGAKAIQLGPNSTATSPAFCVSGNDPYFRYLIRPNQLGSQMLTEVLYQPLPSLGQYVPLASYQDVSPLPGSWAASPPNPLSKLLPLSANGTAMIRLEFNNLAGNYTIGDVWVDPWAR